MNDLKFLNNNEILYYKKENDNNADGLTAYIGETETGATASIDFCKNAHLLIGGSSGSGKSCLVNTILHSLINKYENIYFCIVDIKRVEFLKYKNSPRLAVPIITDVNEASDKMARFVSIMYNRYKILESIGAKNIEEYNKQQEEESNKMARFVIIIDELADVLLDNKTMKIYLQKLLQLGRAVGISCILATQAPNCKTIPTELKININMRIALRVPTAGNSKIIIDKSGAELLNGCGDGILKINNNINKIKIALVKE